MTTRTLEELSEEALKQRLAHGERILRELEGADSAQVVRSGKADQNIDRMRSALDSIEAAQAELARRAKVENRERTQGIIEAAPVRRAFEEEASERKKRQQVRQPLMGALRFVASREHPVLREATITPGNLSDDEAAELIVLVKRLKKVGAGAEDAQPLSDSELARYRELVGVSVGEPGIFARKAQEAERERRLAEAEEERRVASLDKRPKWEEPGSVTLPRFVVHDWLVNDREGAWTVVDLGALAVLLACFENKDPALVANARLEEEVGEPVLVLAGGVGADLRFAGQIGGDSVDPTASGHIRLRPALVTLSRNKWIELEQDVSELRIRLGERARKVRGHMD